MLRRMFFAVVAASSVAASLAAGPHSEADAATGAGRTANHAESKVAPEEFFALKNKHANECLDGNSLFHMYSCNRTRVQQWRFADAGEGKVFLVWKENNKCATSGFRFADCNSSDAAKYTLEKVQQTYEFLKIRDTTDGQCLGAQFRQGIGWGLLGESCHNTDRQLWLKQ